MPQTKRLPFIRVIRVIRGSTALAFQFESICAHLRNLWILFVLICGLHLCKSVGFIFRPYWDYCGGMPLVSTDIMHQAGPKCTLSKLSTRFEDAKTQRSKKKGEYD